MPRLFVAIELDAVVKRTLASARRALRRFDSIVRWVGDEQMHLTLKFLGDTSDGDVPKVCEALAAAAEASTPFEMAVSSGGCFPPKGRVRVVWAGLANADGRLMACQQAVDTAFYAVGFPPEERPFSPHLTLGRVKLDTSDGRLRGAVEGLDVAGRPQPVEKIVLMESQLLKSGAQYMRLGAWSLGSNKS